MNRLTIIGAALLAGLGGCGGGCSDPTITDDFCQDPSVGVVDSVEIGVLADDTFVPIVDDQIVERAFGGQGFAMLPLALRFRGPDVPGCIAHSTEVRNGRGEIVASENQGVHTYGKADGSYNTEPIFMILGDAYGGDRVVVTTTVAGQTASRSLFLDFAVDAGSATDASANSDASDPIDAGQRCHRRELGAALASRGAAC